MNAIPVSKLRSNMMSILKEIEHGSSIDITSRGKIVAKLVPPDYNKEKARKKLLELSKNASIGDIISPIDSQWEVTK